MTKHRQYSIVIHNVDKNSQTKVRHYAEKAKDFVMSIEPYPQGDGFHLHLFLKYSNPRGFKAVLNDLERFKKSIVVPRPAGEERDWGRVQLDVMRGNFVQATSYLKGETKDKPTGEVISSKRVIEYSSEQQQALAQWFKKIQNPRPMTIIGDIFSLPIVSK